MATNKYRFFILTGDPGVGKTTLTKKISAELIDKGVETSGFYTEEVRRNGIREGFDVVTLDGQRGRLARDQGLLNTPVKFNVGKYGVLIQEFENIALPSLVMQENSQSNLLVIDEIGKMEFFSESFKTKVRDIFGQASNCTTLATIPVRKSDSLIENIRNHRQAKVWTVTRENRNKIYDDIMTVIKASLNIN